MRAFPEKVHDDYNVSNQSTRHGAAIQLIVIHDTEGANIPHSNRDLTGLAAFFDRAATDASSHTATDGDGGSIRMVDDSAKAWHSAHFNSVSLGIEQVHKHPDKWRMAQIDETARWVALWSRRYGIPIRKGKVSRDGRVLATGVLEHRDLGNLGGGHFDCTDHFPFTTLLRRARMFKKLQDEQDN
jgi:hypothetical protein